MMLAALRVRGPNSTRRKAAETMESLRLETRHNCVLLEDTDVNRGMLRQAKDFIAYGEVSEETIAALLERQEVDAVDEREHPFRLSPPSNGFKDTKRQYRQGGSLGERDDMDALLARMI